jgi:hypothetical protein
LKLALALAAAHVEVVLPDVPEVPPEAGADGAAGVEAAVLEAAASVLAGLSPVADDSLPAPTAGLAPPELLSAGAVEAPPRKSVTYQPEPLSWKPAAVTCFLKLSAPQAGHTVSKGSEIFCSTSFA